MVALAIVVLTSSGGVALLVYGVEWYFRRARWWLGGEELELGASEERSGLTRGVSGNGLSDIDDMDDMDEPISLMPLGRPPRSSSDIMYTRV
ncbi:hypothetical protein CYMTET_27837 [Cymbomonas tetramitiformis]|uniref:Uncharacterized protein n=1 Tax=Cymbomonas tetramitiformis TaxID=36881 RepID=A0AAE0FPM1_9CHLO|nr:hypothetical protein CYMTET_27837 [Cymbomonas tetramitiformis]